MKEEKEPEFLRKSRIALSKCLLTQKVPSKKLYRRKKKSYELFKSSGEY